MHRPAWPRGRAVARPAWDVFHPDEWPVSKLLTWPGPGLRGVGRADASP